MRLSSESVSSSLKQSGNRSGSRLKKKHKRLDAICEKEYSRNHGDVNENGSGLGTAEVDFGLRRSNRVRRAPVLLDASPSPRKKRRKIHGNGTLGIKKSAETLAQLSDDLNDEAQGNWGTRLRARNSNLGLRVDKGARASRKRKLFDAISDVKVKDSGMKMDLDEKKGKLEDGESMVGRSNRSRRRRFGAMNGPIRTEKEVKSPEIKDDYDREHKLAINIEDEEQEEEEEEEEVEEEEEEEEEEEGEEEKEGEGEEEEEGEGEGEEEEVLERKEVMIAKEERREDVLPLEDEVDDENVKAADNIFPQFIEKLEKETLSHLHIDEACSADHNKEPANAVDNSNNGEIQVEKLMFLHDGENEIHDVEAAGVSTNEVVGGRCCKEKDVDLGKFAEKSMQHGGDLNLKKFRDSSTGRSGKAHIKEGRRCGLCGGGIDGKPPKKLVQDSGQSENEACSGSSASEEPNYDKWDGFGDEPGWLGRLLGPINDRYGIAGIWVHQHCAVWSPEVYFAGLGCLKNVRAALCRGRALKCTRCGRPGATIGCRVDRCPKTYHLPCARANGCIFDHRKFLIACTDHRQIFQPHGNQYLARIKRLKAKKMKLEIKKSSNDAWRRDIEAEEKWLENCGEDEEFLKRESKRLHRDLVRIAPVYIGGSNSEGEKLFHGWESVAGLQGVIQCMKEVVFLPLLYPELFDRFGITPPRGVLLHGYPGTGKTHVVRALIGSCARGDKRIAYFARKGADCLGKYVGDAERQLRLLFQVAERCQPSIIFFDEIDGLAPCRTRQQDQTHNSVVSTLLALLDGLKSRGSVVVIGATNRPEAVDPALRRPGRFDREIYFPLPSVEDRAAILSLHTQKWPKPIDGPLLQWIARRTAGFAGADLQALCTQAAMSALKRNFPLKEVLSDSGEQASRDNRPPLPSILVEERDWLEALLYSPPPCSRREAGMAANDVASSPLPSHLIPFLLQPLSTLLVSLYLDERISLPANLFKAATLIKSVIISALDGRKIVTSCWWSHVHDFVRDADIANEIEIKLQGSGVLLGDSTFGCSGVVNNDSCNEISKFERSVGHRGSPSTTMVEHTSFDLGNKSGFRILIAGNPRSGPRHLASCLLHCYIQHVEIRKVDIATISQEGHGDLVQGISQILLNCPSTGSCIVFMPRIDLWAVEIQNQTPEESDFCLNEDQYPNDGISVKDGYVGGRENHRCSDADQSKSTERTGFQGVISGASHAWENHRCSDADQSKSTERTGFQGVISGASHAWSSFVEQVESLSTPLMILATSEVPFLLLPQEIRQFFRNDLSICRPTTSEHTVPRFSVQIDGGFNHDMVINQSAAELSRDIAKLLVHLIHQKSHTKTSACTKYQISVIQGESNAANQQTDKETANGQAGEKKSPDVNPVRVAPLPGCRTIRVKSNLVSVISTFGYQILQYPHFAELCWVTSKLKEGPSEDVSGPWKGWPFNSCIIRPMSALEKVASSSLSNGKSKEISGIVRGLVAVGLSAIRGAYTSLRKVSFDVRLVLDLLVEQINAKISAGKDRYQYVRLLSQVAYLEDVVNNWAFTLQSLEQDSQKMEASKNHTSGGNEFQCNEVQCEESIRVVSEKSSPTHEILEVSRQGPVDEKVVCNGSLGDGDVDHSHSKDGTFISEGCGEKNFCFCNSVFNESHHDAAAAADDHLAYNIPSNHNDEATVVGPDDLGNGRNCTSVETPLNLRTESVVDLEHHHKNSSELCADEFLSCTKPSSIGNGHSSLENGCKHVDSEPDTSNREVNIHLSPCRSGPSTNSALLIFLQQ
ncbi:uncharacterized protein LOC111012888 isoform X4 [Momordica charantia]|uniref:Uncharacterized protein LOC111012888 isoform X4 n=1 Tax=Momordica charantia TaxID=3673 RepID=A0A6J1CPD4_MOMCH|nr:uncharacterized protein LOC111012888 isoform X4 [Momordica charantia]